MNNGSAIEIEGPSQTSVKKEDAPINETGHTARKTDGLDDEAYVKRVNAWYDEVMDFEADSLEEEDEDDRFFGGHQWKSEHLAKMKSENRPALTLNYCLPMVNAVTGTERQNRTELKVFGRHSASEEGTTAMTSLIRWVMDECYGQYSMSKAFLSAAKTGRGWVGVRADFLNDPEGRVVVEDIPRKEIKLDPLSTDETADSARFLIREKWLSEDDIAARWGDDKMSELLARNYTNENETIRENDNDRSDRYRSGVKISDHSKGTYQVLEVWHYEIIAGAIARNPDTGQIEELTLKELNAILKNQTLQTQAYRQQLAVIATAPIDPANPVSWPTEPPAPLEYTKTPIKRLYQGFVSGTTVLERGDAPVQSLKRFPYVPVFGMRDTGKESGQCCWFGIIRPIKDIQRQHNVEQSAILHILQTNPKSGWIGPKGVFHNKAHWQTKASQPGFIGEYNPNRGKPERIDPPTIPRHIIDLPASRLQSMRDVVGVNVDLMASNTRQDSGKAMGMRKEQGMTVLSTLFDNFKLSKKVLGDVLIGYIQTYVADDRTVRVLGPEGARYVMASKDLALAKYDAIIEEATDTPTDKEAMFQVLQTSFPMIIKSGLPIPPGIIDMFPLPPHVRDEWKAMLQPPAAPNMPPQGMPPGAPPPQGMPNVPQ